MRNRMSIAAAHEIVAEFKNLFPAVAPVDFTVEYRSAIYDGGALAGCFTTETTKKQRVWSMRFTKGYILLSRRDNPTRRECGLTLVHELIHALWTKVGGCTAHAEEFMCREFEAKLYDLIQHRITRKKRFQKAGRAFSNKPSRSRKVASHLLAA